MKDNLIHARTCVYNVNYHIVWSTKYRRKVLNSKIEARLKEILIQVSKENVLVISFIGYITQEIKVNENQTSYNIQMSEDTQTLDEVVVVGFGTQRKANLTDSVATVDTKVLDSRPVTNLGQSVQGTVPGLN